MPRNPRVKSETGIYHIILRGINRQSVFGDDEDRKRLLSTLKRYQAICGYLIYAYCLMSNHVHLLIKIGEEPLEQVMRRISGSYVYWYNQKYDRIGNLFQDRFKSEPVESDLYLLTVTRYIHQNPLKAGIVTNFDDYFWSSYNDYLKGNGITDTSFILSIFSDNKNEAIEQFKRFNQTENDDNCLEIKDNGSNISDEELDMIIERDFKIKAAMIKNEPRDKMTTLLKEILKIDGVSTRQLSRLTGISTGVIWRI